MSEEPFTERWVFDHVLLARHLTELCLVGVLRQFHGDKSELSREELIQLLRAQLKAERELAEKYPKTSRRLYRMLYDGETESVRQRMKEILREGFIEETCAYYSQLKLEATK